MPSRYAAYVGISGGTFPHVKEVIKRRNFLELTIIHKVVVIVGGKSLSKIWNGQKIANRPADEVKTDLEELVRFLKVRMPSASIDTMDILPRQTTKSFFNLRAIIVNRHINQQWPWHHHVSFSDSLVVKTCLSNKDNRISPAREFSGGPEEDGTHLNHDGYNVIKRIVEWLLFQRLTVDKSLMFEAKPFTFHLSYKKNGHD